MAAFGTTAPFGSNTRPSIFPVVACDCARTPVARVKRQMIVMQTRGRRIDVIDIFSSRISKNLVYGASVQTRDRNNQIQIKQSRRNALSECGDISLCREPKQESRGEKHSPF